MRSWTSNPGGYGIAGYDDISFSRIATPRPDNNTSGCGKEGTAFCAAPDEKDTGRGACGRGGCETSGDIGCAEIHKKSELIRNKEQDTLKKVLPVLFLCRIYKNV